MTMRPFAWPARGPNCLRSRGRQRTFALLRSAASWTTRSSSSPIATFIVITSEIEGIPLVAMEAIAAGTPVVTTEVGGLADLIEPGVNGYLVAPDNPEDLITRIRSLLEQPG